MTRRILVTLLVVSTPATALAEQLANGVTGLTLTNVVSGLNAPTAAEMLPDGRIVILEQGGAIRVRPAAGGALIAAGQLPVFTGHNEQGALGLAVDPRFATTNRLYFYYSLSGTLAGNRHRVGYTTIDPQTSRVDTASLMVIVQGLYGPANHNGGGIKFGPDGYLYIGVGDTGCNCSCAPGGDADSNYFASCLTNGNGKILRVTREGQPAPGNPLIGMTATACRPLTSGCSAQRTIPDPNTKQPAREDIYNWGLRNPWRFSWDLETNFLWIGDVGENTWEEVDISDGPGIHFGWPVREGAAGQNPTRCLELTPEARGPCRDPVFAHNQSESPSSGSGSITGGVFSNGCQWPGADRGLYWFGDYVKGRVWTLEPTGSRDGVVSNSRRVVVPDAQGPVHFFTGNDGAIHFVTIAGGAVWRIAPAAPVACTPDAGVTAMDAAFPDALIAFPDAAPPADAAPGDTGVVAGDTGVAPGPDTGVARDTGAAPRDTGVSIADAGTSTTSRRDASTGGDPNVVRSSGCGCSAAGGPEVGVWVLLAFGGFLARRRRS